MGWNDSSVLKFHPTGGEIGQARELRPLCDDLLVTGRLTGTTESEVKPLIGAFLRNEGWNSPKRRP